MTIHYFLFVNSKVCFVRNVGLPAYSKKSVEQIISSSGFTVNQRKCEKAEPYMVATKFGTQYDSPYSDYTEVTVKFRK